MRMRVKWYKIGVNVASDTTYNIKEIPHVNGRYCRRNDIESILERINEQITDSTDTINHLINDMNELRAESNHQASIKQCDSIIKKLHGLQKRIKTCKRIDGDDADECDDCFT